MLGMLQAVMAFALVMILFSTIVSGLTESVLRILRMRSRVLRGAILALGRDIILPQVAETIDPKDTQKQREFADELLVNPAGRQSKKNDPFSRFLDFITRQKNEGQIDSLSTSAFIQRLAKTEAGKAIAGNEDPGYDILVKDFANSFDRYAAASSEVFRKRAHLVSMVVAIFIALLLNVDAGRLFTQLQKNPALTESLLAQADKITAKVETINTDITKPSGDTGKNLEDLTKSLEKVSTEIKDLRSSFDLPIGHDYYPYGQKDGPDKGGTKVERTWAFLGWFFNALLAGLLIGLGGPFWFRVYSNISQFVQVLRSFGGRSSETVEDTRPDSDKTGKTKSPDAQVELFKVSGHIYDGNRAPRVDDTPEPAG